MPERFTTNTARPRAHSAVIHSACADSAAVPSSQIAIVTGRWSARRSRGRMSMPRFASYGCGYQNAISTVNAPTARPRSIRRGFSGVFSRCRSTCSRSHSCARPCRSATVSAARAASTSFSRAAVRVEDELRVGKFARTCPDFVAVQLLRGKRLGFEPGEIDRPAGDAARKTEPPPAPASACRHASSHPRPIRAPRRGPTVPRFGATRGTVRRVPSIGKKSEVTASTHTGFGAIASRMSS